MLKECKLYACASGTLGLHLSRAPWDPYPWVSEVQKGSSAQQAGMRNGDTVLELNGCDILGQKIFEIAEQIRQHWINGAAYLTVMIWRNKSNKKSSSCKKLTACDEMEDELNEVSCKILCELIKFETKRFQTKTSLATKGAI